MSHRKASGTSFNLKMPSSSNEAATKAASTLISLATDAVSSMFLQGSLEQSHLLSLYTPGKLIGDGTENAF